jgi:uncharacterized BrkB/YihY/UPF0761 family membrane protein
LNKNKIYGGLSVVKKFLAFIILCCAFLNICAVINENTTFTEWRDTCFEQLPEYPFIGSRSGSTNGKSYG